MKRYQPEVIYLERTAKDKHHTQQILSRLPNIPVKEIDNRHALLEEMKAVADPLGAGKRSLLLAYDEGETFKPFRESEQYLSCDYFTLHAEEGCALECSYCILQSHLTQPYLTVYTHLDEMLVNLQNTLTQNEQQFFRIGTGQLADSLSLDHITAFSETLVPFFAKQKNAVLELKTKSNNIDRLLALDPQNKTIVGFSMNSRKIQSEEEHKCATIDERLEAAKQLIEAGSYRIGFHFDPIVEYPGWEKEYGQVIEDIFNTVPAERIAWMSLGCFRGDSQLKSAIQKRFPKSQIPLGEIVKGMDGKIRIFKPKRIALYQKMREMILARNPETTLYLSMESPEVWREVFGRDFTKETLCGLLDGAAVRTPTSV